jgi:hypothetical protein
LGIRAPSMAGHCSVGDRDAEGRDWTTTRTRYLGIIGGKSSRPAKRSSFRLILRL